MPASTLNKRSEALPEVDRLSALLNGLWCSMRWQTITVGPDLRAF